MSKAVVQLMVPSAYFFRDKMDKERCIIRSFESVLGWGWSPNAAWNATSHKLRVERESDWMEAIRGESSYREYQAKKILVDQQRDVDL